MRLLLIALGILISNPAHSIMVKSLSGKFDITTERVAHITGSIETGAAKAFKKEMIETIRAGDRVVLIDSGGGLVNEGNEMIALLNTERKEGTRIVCIVVKAAHSMAFNLLTTCDVRLATRKAFCLVHKIERQAVHQQFDGRLTAKRLREIAKQLDISDEGFRQANSKLMGLSLEDYDMFADNETSWTADNLYKRHYLNDIADIIP